MGVKWERVDVEGARAALSFFELRLFLDHKNLPIPPNHLGVWERGHGNEGLQAISYHQNLTSDVKWCDAWSK